MTCDECKGPLRNLKGELPVVILRPGEDRRRVCADCAEQEATAHETANKFTRRKPPAEPSTERRGRKPSISDIKPASIVTVVKHLPVPVPVPVPVLVPVPETRTETPRAELDVAESESWDGFSFSNFDVDTFDFQKFRLQLVNLEGPGGRSANRAAGFIHSVLQILRNKQEATPQNLRSYAASAIWHSAAAYHASKGAAAGENLDFVHSLIMTKQAIALLKYAILHDRYHVTAEGSKSGE